MIAADTIGKRIAMLRKEKKLSQEQLAEQLKVSAQAVSKWETGRTLPETATLPLLARVLGHSIDSILLPLELVILSAVYTDGLESRDLTAFLSSFVAGDRLLFPVSEETLPFDLPGERVKVLLVKYQLPSGSYAATAWQGSTLKIGPGEHLGTALPAGGELAIVDAFYGNERASRSVMSKLQHYAYFRWDSYAASHELFPSLIDNEGADYLLLLFANAEGIMPSVAGRGNASITMRSGPSSAVPSRRPPPASSRESNPWNSEKEKIAPGAAPSSFPFAAAEWRPHMKS